MEVGTRGPNPSPLEVFIEQLGLDFERLGASRSLGRLFGYLLVQDGPKSQDQVSAELGLSKGMTSIAMRQAVAGGLAQVVPRPGDRRHYYAVAPDCWVTSTLVQLQVLVAWKHRAQEGVRALDTGGRGESRPAAQLRDAVLFFEFLESLFAEVPEQFARYRAERASRSDGAP